MLGGLVMTLLRLSARARRNGVVVVELVGEADLASARNLSATLSGIELPPAPAGALVLLDLSRLYFCDAAGLGAMVAGARGLAGRGARLALFAPRRSFLRLLEITKLDGYFEVFPRLLVDDGRSPAVRPACRGVA